MKNSMANTLKTLGILIGVIGFFGATFVGANFGEILVFVTVFFSCGISGLLLYAFGEAIGLLQDIKNNTQKSIVTEDIPRL